MNETKKFNVTKFYKASTLVSTHITTMPGMGGRNIIKAHMDNSSVDKRCSLFIENNQWGLSRGLSHNPELNGPSSNKRSPS